MNLLLSEAIMNSQYMPETDSYPNKKIQMRPQIRSIFGGIKVCICISKNKTQSIVQRCTTS